MPRLGKTLFAALLLWAAAFGYELNVTSSARSVYVGEPLRLVYTFGHTASDETVDFRFAAPELAHFQVLESRTETLREGGTEVWKKVYVIAPLQVGTVAPGAAAMNVAERAYEKDAWGQWMPTVKWEQHGFASVGVFANPVPPGVGAVGRFSVRAVTDVNATDSGKAVHLTLSIKGCGNLVTAELPRPEIAGVSVFDEGKTEKAQWREGCYYMESNRTFALVGERNFMIPSMVLRSFDPQRNAVVAAQSLPIPIHVTAAKRIETKQGEEAMTVWSLGVGILIGIVIGAAAMLLWQRRKPREKRKRYDSLRAALIELFKHLDDPDAKKSVEAVEKHLYEAGPAPDAAALSETVGRLKRGKTHVRRED